MIPTKTSSTRDEQGFTLVELTVVLFVIAILMVMGLAAFAQMTRIADDKGAHLDLLTAVKVQSLQHLETGEFTLDVGVLFDLEPTLRYSNAGDPPKTIALRSEVGRLDTDICLFSRTEQGAWFAMYHSVVDGDRYGQSDPIACTVANTAAWTTESW